MNPGNRRDFGPKPELAWVKTARLSVDMAYQRSLESGRSQALIARIAAEFDWALFGTVMVAPLALDSLELMDGQHRVAGARLAGIKEVPASIIQAPSVEQRARIFRDSNKQRVAMHAFSLHHAGVKAGDPAALAIARLCESVDIEVPRYPIQQRNLKPNQCLALTVLRQLAAEARGDQAERALRILRAAFFDEPGGLRAHLILGLREWVRLHPNCDELATATALQRHGLHKIEARVFSIGLGGARRFEAVLKVVTGIVPWAAAGRLTAEDADRPAPKLGARQAAFAPRNQDLLDRAAQMTVKHVDTPPAFDPAKLATRPRPAEPLKRGNKR